MTSFPFRPSSSDSTSGQGRLTSARQRVANQPQSANEQTVASGYTNAQRRLTPIGTNVAAASNPWSSRRTDNHSSSSASSNSGLNQNPASTFSSALNSDSSSNPRDRGHKSQRSIGPVISPNKPTSASRLSLSQLLSNSPNSASPTSALNPFQGTAQAAAKNLNRVGSGSSSSSITQRASGSIIGSQSAGNTFHANLAISPSSSNGIGQDTTRVVIAQVSILLGFLKDDSDKPKWEKQANQIRKLVGSNMDVFIHYFRKLVSTNASRLALGAKDGTDTSGSLALLIEEVKKVTADSDQAARIAEALDLPDGDCYKDFELGGFTAALRLDALEKTVLALAFLTSPHERQREAATNLILNQFNDMHALLADWRSHTEMPSAIIERVVHYLTDGSALIRIDEDAQMILATSVRLRYQARGLTVPTALASKLAAIKSEDSENSLSTLLRRYGPASTKSASEAKSTLRLDGSRQYSESQIVDAILFLTAQPSSHGYIFENFISALENASHPHLEWSGIIKAFDQPQRSIQHDQLKSLLRFFILASKDGSNVPIQNLWAGSWTNHETQLAYLTCFTQLDGVDISQVPGIEFSFTVDDFEDSDPAIQELIREAVKNPLVSTGAIVALIRLAFEETSDSTQSRAGELLLEVAKMFDGLFLCGAFALEKPWPEEIKNNLTSLFRQFLNRQLVSYQAVLPLLWRRDSHWVASCLIELHLSAPITVGLIFEQALHFGWLDDLLTIPNGLGLDLAAYAHSRSKLELEGWLRSFIQARPTDMVMFLIRFMNQKVKDELRDDDEERRQAPLAVKTVSVLMSTIDEHLPVQATTQLNRLEEHVIEAYPRLCNYGEGYDDIIDANGQESNKLPAEIELRMQKYYEELYGDQTNAEPIVHDMDKFKCSSNPQEQDLFACLVHNLFMEYPHLKVYSAVALGWAAVLYGTLVGHRLISGISMKVALRYILEAVEEEDSDLWKFRFGAQALEKLVARLPELPKYCETIVGIPNLRDSNHPAFIKAQEVLQQLHENPDAKRRQLHGLTNGHSFENHKVDGSVDGIMEDMVAASLLPSFESIHAESSVGAAQFADPEEDVQDKVLFVLNNVSEQNLESKLQDLVGVLEAKHHQWFAEYLVEHRAKMQPNYHGVYLDLLTKLGEKSLWTEVLRETYVSIVKMLNSESTSTSSHERTYLKSLGSWLGLLTLARNKPVRHRNIAFVDLLLEAFETQRLVSVLPFTCKVLEKASESVIFQPPNPWLMNILKLLVEFYRFAELKLNLKFEIEVLCKNLNLNYKDIEPAITWRQRPVLEDEPTNILPDNGGAFNDDLTAGLGGITGRYNLEALLATLPDIGPLLRYPDLEGFVLPPHVIRAAIQTAVEEAIRNIILPTVDRTVSVTATTTTDVVISDFSMESSEELLQDGAFKMARALVGPLAMVTCKDPLRMNMTANLRNAFQMDGEGGGIVPEAFIMICVNDNIDLACEVVQRAAEDHSMAEIEDRLGPAVLSRIQHRQSQSQVAFADPVPNPYAFRMPDPYKFSANGLNEDQLRVYEEFSHDADRHALSYLDQANDSYTRPPSQYAGDNIVQEGSDRPHRPLSADHDMPRSRGTSAARTLNSHPHLNGYPDGLASEVVLERLLLEMRSAASLSEVIHFRDLKPDDPIQVSFDQFFALLYRLESRAAFAASVAPGLCMIVLDESHKPMETELNLNVIRKLCKLEPTTESQVVIFFDSCMQQEKLNVSMILSLLDLGLTDFRHVDLNLQQSLRSRREGSVGVLMEIMNEVLLSSRAKALRTDFAASISAITQWAMEDSRLDGAAPLFKMLADTDEKKPRADLLLNTATHDQEQVEYTFLEWVHLCGNPAIDDRGFAVFVAQMHHRHVLQSPSDTIKFFRICVEMCLNDYEDQSIVLEASQRSGNEQQHGEAYLYIDALAKLVVLFAKHHGLENNHETSNHQEHMDRILSLLVLLLFQRERSSGRDHQKPFYRLFSSILCNVVLLQDPSVRHSMALSFKQKLVILRPDILPGFACAWLTLISHRNFLFLMLYSMDVSESSKIPPLWTDYAELLILALNWLDVLQHPDVPEIFSVNVYKGLIRIFLVLHHDFGDFLAVHHVQLCNAIPTNCIQLRNLVLNAPQSRLLDAPHPLMKDLEIEHLVVGRQNPFVAFDYEALISAAGLSDDLDEALTTIPAHKPAAAVLQAIRRCKQRTSSQITDETTEGLLLPAIILRIAATGVAAAQQTQVAKFDTSSPAANFLLKLVTEADPDTRYQLMNAMANQLRYPSGHTIMYIQAIQFLFEQEGHPENAEVRQCILRVLLERVLVPQPHPWGVLVAVVEIVRNPQYAFWDLPFIQGAPGVQHLIQSVIYGTLPGSEPEI